MTPKDQLKLIRSVIDQVLWTAGATEHNRALLAGAIHEKLLAAEPAAGAEITTTAEFLAAARRGDFTGTVLVDNDNVSARVNDESVFDFQDQGPAGVLLDVLEALGIEAENV